jgi:hypothetical protein
MRTRGATRILRGGVVLLALGPTALYAAPLSSGAGSLALEARMSTAVERAASRQCYWRNGARVCRRGAQRPYAYRPQPQPSLGFSYGNPIPESLPPGSTAWWEAMERWGRTGGRIR